MSIIAERITQLGYAVPEVATPVAAYVPATRVGNYIYTSGQLPVVDGALAASGKVKDASEPGFVTPEEAQKLAEICALNGIAAAGSLLESLDKIVRVVKVTAFVASDPSFTGQAAVANGASVLLGKIFGDAGIHVRSAVGLTVLPLDAPVEIEFVFEVEPE